MWMESKTFLFPFSKHTFRNNLLPKCVFDATVSMRDSDRSYLIAAVNELLFALMISYYKTHDFEKSMFIFG